MLQIGSVVFQESEGQVCPAPTDVPPAVRATLLEALDTQPETIIYSGVSLTRTIRFASGNGLGWCSPQMKVALMQLYLAQNTFSVVTDLLGERGAGKEVTYGSCFFEPGSVPQFGPHEVLNGLYHHYDLLIRMPLVGS